MKLKYLIFFGIFSFYLNAQNIQVIWQTEIPLESKAYYPVLNADGTLLLFTGESFTGLSVYDFGTKKIKAITDAQNAGYDPLFSADNSKVFFRNTTFENGRRYDALESYDLRTGKQIQMLSPRREMRQARNYHNGILVQANRRLVKSTFGGTNSEIPVYISSEDLKMFVYNNGVRKEIKPFEKANYIWASLSPDSKKILFTATGKGTYICDLNGKIISSLGYLNAPVWYNDKYVIGMQDKDDGQFVTSSAVLLVSTDGKIKKQISNPKHIAMYPCGSLASGKVVYNTVSGRLIVSQIEIK